ncbi:MAG: hypothetical protein WCR36_10420, partial [Bacteroidaceae bacterium]
GRYPELKEAIYSDEIWFNESMEIDPTQTKPLDEDSNYVDILDWVYSALCILGKADENSTNGKTESEMHSEPCFINSKIEPYNFSSSEFSKLMDTMKKEMSLVFENINNIQEGGLPLADEKEIVEENVDEVIEETTEPTVEETVDAEVIDAPADEVEPTEVVDENSDTVDVVETEQEVEHGEDFEKIETVEKSVYDSLVSDFESYKESHSHSNEEFDELENFKNDMEKKKRKCELDDTFAKFDKKLSGFAEYESLKSSEITMDIAELEEKLFAMIGKKTANFSARPKETTIAVPVETYEETDDDGYGGILARKYNK